MAFVKECLILPYPVRHNSGNGFVLIPFPEIFFSEKISEL
jgi:hypothetical protein